MSKVNFIENFNLFMEYGRREKLTANERVLYLALFEAANARAMADAAHEWPDDYFSIGNAELAAMTGLAERTIRNARASLMERGLIEFMPGRGKKKDPEYRVFYMARDGRRIAPVYVALPEQVIAENIGCKNDLELEFVENDAGRDVPEQVIAEKTGCKNDLELEFAENIGCKNVPDEAPYKGIFNPVKYIYKIKNKNRIVSPHPIYREKEDAITDGDGGCASVYASVRERIDYDDLVRLHGEDAGLIDGITEVMAETAAFDGESMLVARARYPAGLVKKRILGLDFNGIEYVLGCLKAVRTKVYNIKKYILAVLFNAAATMDAYYMAEVNYGLAT